MGDKLTRDRLVLRYRVKGTDDVSLFWLPLRQGSWLFPLSERTPVLVAVKHGPLDDRCGPLRSKAAGVTENGMTFWRRVAGHGSGKCLSEEPALESQRAALEPVAAPKCSPGAVTNSIGSWRSWQIIRM